MKEFNVKEAADGCINWIGDWFAKYGNRCMAFVGMSGGKDSSVVGGLCVKALGADRVAGVMMPNHTQTDIEDSVAIIDHLGIKDYTYNIGPVVDKMMYMLELAIHKDKLDVPSIASENLPPRVRMASLYLMSQYFGGRVSNNCNASEEFIGYSTHYGDDAGDFAPIRDFTVSEVIEIGRYIGIPERFLVKAPSDGLCGKTDEDKIGFTYAVLDKFIRTGICEDESIRNKIVTMHNASAFKRRAIAQYDYWRETVC